MNQAELIVPLVVGFLLDAILGDPRSIPHPVVLFGNSISAVDRWFNKGKNRKLKGLIAATVLILLAFLLFYLIIYLASLHEISYYLVSSVCVFLGLANRGLITEGLKVNQALEKDGLEAGRRQVSFIVGRDTSKLNAQQIRRAVLETMAENLSDGVVAPLFYFLLGGIPLMFTYKMINTLDSMIGYKNEKYKDFGWFAAKTDDAFNYIPARITALIMAIISMCPRAFQFIFKYGNKHSSPNAGYPEAALAGILNCKFGGPNVYHGKLVDKPFIGEKDKEISNNDIRKTVMINAKTSIVSVVLIVILLSFYGDFIIIGSIV